MLDYEEDGGYQIGNRIYYQGTKRLVQTFELNFGQPTGPEEAKEAQNDQKVDPGALTNLNDLYVPITASEGITDYGRKFYNTTRRIHIERTHSERPGWSDIFQTWKMLNKSKLNVKEAKNPLNKYYEDNPEFVAKRNGLSPWGDKESSRKVSKETQIRLHGKPFSKTSSEPRKDFADKMDLIQGKETHSARYTIRKHHRDFESENQLKECFEEGLLIKRREDAAREAREAHQKRAENVKKEILANQQRIDKKLKRGVSRREQSYINFVNDIIDLHRVKDKLNLDFVYPETLFNFWATIPPKLKKDPKYTLNFGPAMAKEILNNFFASRIEHVHEMFKKRKGVETTDLEALHRYYTDEYPDRNKQQFAMRFFCEENSKKIFGDWCRERRELANRMLSMYKQEIKEKRGESNPGENGGPGGKPKSKRQLKKERKKELKERRKLREKQESNADYRSRPKDVLKTGKTMLKMREAFPRDKIIQKMIVEEFKDDPGTAKGALESEGAPVAHFEALKTKKLKKGEKKKKIMKEFEQKRALELRHRYAGMLDGYKADKKRQDSEMKKAKRREERMEEDIERFLLKSAQEYKKLRNERARKLQEKDRYYARVKGGGGNDEELEALEDDLITQNEFIFTKYLAFKKKRPEVVKAKFPGFVLGEKEGFGYEACPAAFKSEFFRVYRLLDKEGNLLAKDRNLVGFWAPAGAKVPRSTFNAKIRGNSVAVRSEKVWERRKKRGLWEDENYAREREMIMMTLDDAKNCTFRPVIAHRLPKKMLRSKIPDDLKNAKTKKKRVKMEEEMLKTLCPRPKNPKFSVKDIYKGSEIKNSKKKGALNYATFLLQNTDYRPEMQAYEHLAKHFDLNEIRNRLGDPKKHPRPVSGSRLDSILNKANEDRKKGKKGSDNGENFNDPKNLVFLVEVLDFASKIEKREFEVLESKLLAEQMYDKLGEEDNHPKTEMCPLAKHCPDYIEETWPNPFKKKELIESKRKAMRCEFAHHPSQIVLPAQEINKEKYLRRLVEVREAQLETGDLPPKNSVFVQSGAIEVDYRGLMKARSHPGLEVVQSRESPKVMLKEAPVKDRLGSKRKKKSGSGKEANSGGNGAEMTGKGAKNGSNGVEILNEKKLPFYKKYATEKKDGVKDGGGDAKAAIKEARDGGEGETRAEKLKNCEKVQKLKITQKLADRQHQYKLGLYRRARSMYSTQRYKEAEGIIVEAMKMIFKERMEAEEQFEADLDKIRALKLRARDQKGSKKALMALGRAKKKLGGAHSIAQRAQEGRRNDLEYKIKVLHDQIAKEIAFKQPSKPPASYPHTTHHIPKKRPKSKPKKQVKKPTRKASYHGEVKSVDEIMTQVDEAIRFCQEKLTQADD